MSVTETRAQAGWLDQNQYPFQSHHVQVDGGDMHYIDEGEGDAIFFVHGFPTWSFMWRNLVRDLSAKHRCIAMDHIGFGLSDKPDHWSYTPEAHARNFRKLLDHIGVTTYSLVVHDFGGPIALSHALDFPGRLNRLVVVNSFLWSLKTDPHFVKFDHKVNGPLGRMALESTPIGLNKMLHDMVCQKQKVSSTIYSQYTGPYHKPSERHGPYGLAKGYVGSSTWLYDLWVRREEISKKPALIVWGMKDSLFSHEHLDKWRHAFPNAETAIFPESGHIVLEESARDVEAEIYLFQDGQSELASVQKAINGDLT
jgi:haloalkane dehalogenase